MQPSTQSIAFTPAERAEIKKRQRESAKLIAKLAATETLDEQQRLADELCPRFHDWIPGATSSLNSASGPAARRTDRAAFARTGASIWRNATDL